MINFIELDEYYEMPCLCNCGEWFDLNDGFQSQINKGNSVICPQCHKDEEKSKITIKELNKNDKFFFGSDNFQVAKKFTKKSGYLMAETDFGFVTKFKDEDEIVYKIN